MFSNTQSNCDEDYFANINYSKNIECIIPTLELLINFRNNGILAKKSCFVYAEKMDFKGLIQLRLTEKADHRKMYIATVDTNSFHELKQDQSLHVTFSGFVENLVKILQDCQVGKLEINLVQNPRDNQLILQFYEMRSFKNLIHLCLPIKVAPLNVVLFYMNSILDSLQRKNISHETVVQNVQHDLNANLRRIEQLENENSKLKESLVENSKLAASRHKEEIYQLQENIKHAAEQRNCDNERNRKTIATLQSKLEKAATDKAGVISELSKEASKNETLREELSALKSNLATAKEQIEKLVAEVSALKNLDRKNEMHLGDSRKHILELQDKLKKYDKLNSDLIAELEAEKKICKTKRQAIEICTEEISKANEIIAKKSQQLIKLDKTIGWRTEVALQQEKVIKEKDKLLIIRNEQINNLQQAVENLRKEIPQQLESMKKFADAIEVKYSEQIKAINQKIASGGKENYHELIRSRR